MVLLYTNNSSFPAEDYCYLCCSRAARFSQLSEVYPFSLKVPTAHSVLAQGICASEPLWRAEKWLPKILKSDPPPRTHQHSSLGQEDVTCLHTASWDRENNFWLSGKALPTTSFLTRGRCGDLVTEVDDDESSQPKKTARRSHTEYSKMVHTWNPSTYKPNAGRLPCIQGQPGL